MLATLRLDVRGSLKKEGTPYKLNRAFRDCQTSLVSRLSQDRVGDPRPVRQVMENGVRHDRLPNDERRQNVKVDSVDTPVDDHVAGDAEKNQQVHTSIKNS